MGVGLLFLLGGAPVAHGDGKVFATPRVAPNVALPDQRALICYTGGIERLVIETSFAGAGTNFAWVVPVPSVPRIEPVTKGLFPTLQVLFAPTLIHAVPRYFLAVLFAGALVYLLLTVRATGRLPWSDAIACALCASSVAFVQGFALVGLLLGLFLLVAVFLLRREEPVSSIVLLLGLAMLLSGFLLPGFATAGAGVGGSHAGVEILERQTVGVFDTVTLAGREPGTLVRWLQTNGFAVSTSILPAVESYLREGWVFVAAKARREADTASAERLHPLCFTFATTNPVYPLRLTGVDNDSCSVELFVFGPGLAEVPGFKIEHCATPCFPKQDDQMRVFPGGLNIRHRQLASLVTGAAVATKLSAHLRRDDMRHDAMIAWRAFEPHQTILYSVRGAATTAANFSLPFLAAGVLLIEAGRRRSASFLWRWRSLGWRLCLLAIVAGSVVFLGLPRVSVNTIRTPRYYLHSQHRVLSTALAEAFLDHPLPEGDRLKTACQRLTDLIADQQERFRQNVFTGARLREEDSPGNYVLRQSPDGLEYVWFDVEGAERVEWLWP